MLIMRTQKLSELAAKYSIRLKALESDLAEEKLLSSFEIRERVQALKQTLLEAKKHKRSSP